jgi:hypothetical protein
MKSRKFLGVVLWVVAVGIVAFIGIQFIPYGKSHTNPPVINEPSWDSVQTRQIVKQACFDCHSNETIWPWYSNIAPVSWLVQFDVQRGRRIMNFSEWNNIPAGYLVNAVQEGEMPPLTYRLMHPNARLNADQKQALINGLQASLK